MYIQDWIYFAEVAQCENITTAASRLYRTYQGIHKSIIKLETEFGRPLFDRTGNTIQLNDFGRFMYSEIAVPLLERWALAEDGPAQYDQYTDTSFRLGIYLSNGPRTTLTSDAEGLCADFQSLHPEAHIDIVKQSNEKNYDDLLSGALDIAMCSSYPHDNSVLSLAFVREEVCVIMSDLDPLASGSSVELSTILKRDLQMPVNAGPLTRYIQSLPGFDSKHQVIFDPDSPSYDRLLQENHFVRIRTLREVSREKVIPPGCNILHFSPPLYFTTDFITSKKRIRKKMLKAFWDFLGQRTRCLQSVE